MRPLPREMRFDLPMQRGESVRRLQAALARRGFLSPDEADGLFGPRTRDAVSAFQRSCGLTPTGIADVATVARVLLSDVGAADPETTDLEDGNVSGGLPRRPAAEVVPPELLPPANPKRVILHWTAGNNIASDNDREHYHFLIEADGNVVRGKYTIADNESTGDRRYAAHTLNCNTRSVGVAVCGMVGAVESPFSPGPAPIAPLQIERMAALVAQICTRYNLPVTRKIVLGHGEVQEFLGIPQKQKWDVLALPWAPQLSKRAVGDQIRANVVEAMTGIADAADAEARDLDVITGTSRIPGGAFASDGATWARLDRLVPAFGWSIADVSNGRVALRAGETLADLKLAFAPDDSTPGAALRGAVRIDDLAAALDMAFKVGEDATVTLAGAPGGGERVVGSEKYRTITVARGDSLSRIARREMGANADWRSIRDAQGREFDEASARRLQPGEQVLIPVAAAAEAPPPPPAAFADEGWLTGVADSVASAAVPGNQKAARSATPRLLWACIEAGVTDPAHLAYVLATAEHETNFGRQMIEVWKDSEAQRGYEGRNGNNRPGDGKLFSGRGYVQLTFRGNYRRFGQALNLPLESQPDLAADPEIAAKIMAAGMSRLGYCDTKKVLKAYGFGEDFDFERARDIVNGDRDKPAQSRYGTTIGRGIAGQARKYYQIIQAELG